MQRVDIPALLEHNRYFAYLRDKGYNKRMAPPVNLNQVGGTHYKTPIEHWDYVIANDIPYLEAQIIKYLTRWRKKDGAQDLRKAQHFLQKLFETELLPWSETLADSGVPGPRYVNQDPDQARFPREQVFAHTQEKDK